MLAKATMDDVWDLGQQPEAPETPPYDGFPLWNVFLTEPNRERRSADLLLDRLELPVYWPHYATKVRCGPRAFRAVLRSVLPGVLLAPVGILSAERDDHIVEWAHLKPVSFGRPLTKAEIEIIRQIEAKLNIRPANCNGPVFRPGQRVQFKDEMWAAFLGEATVTALVSGNRISIKIDGKLFGGKDEMTVPAAELEAM